MGTAKRERQKANRALKQQEEAKAAKVSRVKRGALRWGIGAIVAIAGVVLIAYIGGAFDGDDDVDVDVTVPPTIAAVTIPELSVADVTVPDSTVTPATSAP